MTQSDEEKTSEDYWFEYSHESIVEGLRSITEANFKQAIRMAQTDLRDQLSKEREKHDAEIKRIQASCNQAIKDVKMDYDAYAAEREMRKELVQALKVTYHNSYTSSAAIESLIAKAS